MKRQDLLKTHKNYDKNLKKWELCRLAYDGGTEFIEHALHRHSRESYKNWLERLTEGVDFNYAEAIIDLFNFYLTEKPMIRDFVGIDKDPQFMMFQQDTDYHGTNYHEFIVECQKFASVYGCVGVLVNKVSGFKTVAEEIANKVFPHCVVFTPQNILDWKYQRNVQTGRQDLIYLKLKEEDGEYLILTQTYWERWKDVDTKKEPELVDSGVLPIGEIPFLWFYNLKSLAGPKSQFGKSDIDAVGRITASIIRNFSNGEEALKFAGFPILREPMEPDNGDVDEGPAPNQSKAIGQRGVMEFNPELGEAGKPDWMEPKILESIEALLKWTDRKTDEIYRIVHLSGVHGQRKSNNEVSSGLALRYEFQQLYSVLSKKAENMCEAELKIIYFWLKWQNKADLFKKISIKHSKSFSVDDLSVDLDNCFLTIEKVASKTFQVEMQLKVAKNMLPDLPDDTVNLIQQELIQAPTVLPKTESAPKPKPKAKPESQE